MKVRFVSVKLYKLGVLSECVFLDVVLRMNFPVYFSGYIFQGVFFRILFLEVFFTTCFPNDFSLNLQGKLFVCQLAIGNNLCSYAREPKVQNVFIAIFLLTLRRCIFIVL